MPRLSTRKLTERSIDALKAPQTGQKYLWDSEQRGFGVRVIKSGLKTFIFQYRNRAGIDRRMRIGRYPDISLEKAREQAKILIGRIAEGEDPAGERDDIRKSITVSEVCEWYLKEAEGGRILGKRGKPIKRSTLKLDRVRIEAHIKPLLGRRQVDALQLADVEKMQADIAAGKTAKSRSPQGRGGVPTGGSGAASRTVSTLHSLLAHAKRLNVVASNPAVGVRKIADNKKTARLSLTEIEKLGDSLRSGVLDGESRNGVAAICFILFTGFRRTEALACEHSWINTDKGFVSLPDSKSGPQVRAIGTAAVALASAQDHLAGNPYLFPASTGDGHFTAASPILKRATARIGRPDVSLHTLRHTFASVAGDLGFSELTIRAMLGHGVSSVTQGYVHIDEALRIAVNKTSEEIRRRLGEGMIEFLTAGASR